MLITGEYGVIDGALAFAVPTKYGQYMKVKAQSRSDIKWISYDQNGEVWFEATMELVDFTAVDSTDKDIAKHISKLLKSAVRLNSEFLDKWNGFKVETYLEFDRLWGLGSSSTLTYLVANWADVHPLMLHFKHSNGSGYDVACASSDTPILYQVSNDEIKIEPLEYFNPTFADQLYFVYLNQKQSSSASVDYYHSKIKSKNTFVKTLTDLTEAIVETNNIKDFSKIIDEHEKLIAKSLELKCVKDEYFQDFGGSVKSLGSWGGDFVLAASDRSKKETIDYFKSKGFETILSLDEIVYLGD